jgi:hypothetical protein
VIEGGLDGPINAPSVQVFGFAQTPLLGVIEFGAGAAMVLVLGLVPSVRSQKTVWS